MLRNIRIVLVETSHTGNIGSAARAMKTMGLMHLYLVKPQLKPDAQAVMLAAGASDILDNAKIVDTLDQAVAGCSLVLGTSARPRSLSWPKLNPRECAVRSITEAKSMPVAIIFGRERAGLTNTELQKCHYHVEIAANPEYSSLNLAMSVQIMAYEMRVAFLEQQMLTQLSEKEIFYPKVDELEYFYQHLEQVLVNTGFIQPTPSSYIMRKLRLLFTRAKIESAELSLLRGILTSIKKYNSL